MLDTKYDSKLIEDKIYKKWLDNHVFHAKVNNHKKPFTIIMPPPNITGKLHMGHALDASIQDTIIRYKKMCGFETLWQPGTDHAAISTEVKVVDRLKERGIDKHELGREGFLVEAWKWKEEFESNIIKQQYKLGASCDWDRLRFTMDSGCSKAVLKVFCDLYNKGIIYKGKKIINWCPKCHTTISDAEVIHEEKEGNFYYIKYYLDGKDEYLNVATTRPETILGDSAICVNPKDERYNSYIGQMVYVPIVNRRVPIIGDEHANIDFGTGVVKITPSHDPNDFEVGKRHNLEEICILDDDAKINLPQSKYHGMDRYECRKEIVKDLQEKNLLIRIEKHDHNVGIHDRCSTTIEPMIKDQWFVKMDKLKEPAIKAYKENKLKFIPNNYGLIYLHWLENIKDWCISRQIWWGHRIPAFYCQDCGKITVTPNIEDLIDKSNNKDLICPHCKSHNVLQDEDTLDTWFSSALWPFSTLGWPEKTKEMSYFFPTNVLVTAYDIIFFWVVRMVFSSLENTKKLPFYNVLIHGIIRDDKGRKMSKSLGNGIDPLDIINKYGADALRIALLSGNAPGNDMRFYIDRVENGRNFLNKVWNASRFIQMNDIQYNKNIKIKLKLEDKWILSKLNTLIKEVHRNIDSYDLGIALDKIQKFIWEEFCDWYIEIAKPRLQNDKEKISCLVILKCILTNSLKLLHPFCPFITEEIFGTFNKEKILLMQNFPEYDKKFSFNNEEKEFEYIKEIVKQIRTRRAELNVPNKKKSTLYIKTKDKKITKLIKECDIYIKNLTQTENIIFIKEDLNTKNMVNIVINKANLFIPLSELVDMNEEKKKIEINIQKMKNEILRSQNMLNNENFIKKAPQDKINDEKEKLKKYNSLLIELEERLSAF
ncbi:MAG: valine--tRNA ligase [Eubacteriales bacterium]|nr:valine--tRNA ligase [Eubacteriales bacterium]